MNDTPNDSPTQSPIRHLKSPLWAMAGSILFVTLIVGALVYFGVHEQLLSLLQWVDAQGAWAATLFILIMAGVVVLLLPGILFTTGAGFVFGLLEGTLYVVLGTTLGAALAFLIARYLFGRRARHFIVAHSRLRMVSEEMTRHDWKVVLLTRLIPFFPSKISNYFFGMTGFSFRGYVLGSLIGFIPFSLHNVYLGSIAADLATLGKQEIGRSPLEWVLYATGFIATVVAIVFFNRLARRALNRYTRSTDPKEEVS
ncbi:TVP38/TMEM64 family protein [Sedimenticola hydrogenitrophicus]|uniref:TVP38/TMEM64 family protein n=1 Tax=Sedimenticola hydrogenitrophicus TaxID=2967975 RepID=UPI0023B08483|nr:TVP38/TMEM64 family protein [Sedimenticola hydrogenitrophicus]